MLSSWQAGYWPLVTGSRPEARGEKPVAKILNPETLLLEDTITPVSVPMSRFDRPEYPDSHAPV